MSDFDAQAAEWDTQWEQFEALKRSFTCQRCKAAPGDRCRDKAGHLTRFDHASRNEKAWHLIALAASPATPQQMAWARNLAKAWGQQ